MLDDLIERNRRFAAGLEPGLPPLPAKGLVILTCMDHRVDPAAALGLGLGDAMVIRNAGGRVTPAFLADLAILAQVAEGRGSNLANLELLLIQHTDCGAAAIAGVTDQHEAIRKDLEALEADSRVPADLSVTGMIYDTATGRITLSG